MSSLSLAPTLSGATYLCRCPQNTQNVVNPTWIVRAENKKKKKTHFIQHVHTQTHKHTKDKGQRKKFNTGLVPNCKREAAVTASIPNFSLYGNDMQRLQLIRLQQSAPSPESTLPLCVLLFCSSTVSTKISGTIMVPLSSVQLPAITLRVAHSI